MVDAKILVGCKNVVYMVKARGVYLQLCCDERWLDSAGTGEDDPINGGGVDGNKR